MADANELLVKITADVADLEKALAATQKGVGETDEKIKGLGSSTTSIIKGLAGFTVLQEAFSIIKNAVVDSIKSFADFQDAMLNIRTLLNDTSFGAKSLEQGFKDLTQGILDLSKNTAVSATDAAKGLFDIVSSGIQASDALGVLTATSKLAVAGQTDVANASQAVVGALNAYGLSADQADVVAAKFFQAQVTGVTTVERLARGFGLVAASAASMGVSLDDLLAAESAATLAGIKTNDAYTDLRQIMQNVSKPTEDAKIEAERLGVTFNTTALRAKGLQGFLLDLTSATGFTKESVEKLFGSVDSQKTVFAITGNQAKAYGDTLKALSDETSNAATLTEAFRIKQDSVSNQMVLVKNNLTVITNVLIAELAPAFVAATTATANFLKSVQDTLPKIKPWLTDISSSIVSFLGSVGATDRAADALAKNLTKGFDDSKIKAEAAFKNANATNNEFLGVLDNYAKSGKEVVNQSSITKEQLTRNLASITEANKKNLDVQKADTIKSIQDRLTTVTGALSKELTNQRRHDLEIEKSALEVKLAKLKYDEENKQNKLKLQNDIVAIESKGSNLTLTQLKKLIQDKQQLYDLDSKAFEKAAFDKEMVQLRTKEKILEDEKALHDQGIEYTADLAAKQAEYGNTIGFLASKVGEKIMGVANQVIGVVGDFAKASYENTAKELETFQADLAKKQDAAAENDIKRLEQLNSDKTDLVREQLRLEEQLQKESSDAKQKQLQDALHNEQAILDFANSNKEDLQRQYDKIAAQLFFETDATKKKDLQDQLDVLSGKIVTANADQLKAQQNYDAKKAQATKDLGIAQVQSTQEQLDAVNQKIADNAKNIVDTENKVAKERADAVTEADRKRLADLDAAARQQFEISKAAQISQVAIQTTVGAISAFASLASIPIAGPVLGGIAAGAVVAAGALAASQIIGQQYGKGPNGSTFGLASISGGENTAPGGGFFNGGFTGLTPEEAAAVQGQGTVSSSLFSEGGTVPGPVGAGDIVPAMLSPGEVVIPRLKFNEFVSAMKDTQGGAASQMQNVNVVLEMRGDANKILNAYTLEDRALGISAI